MTDIHIGQISQSEAGMGKAQLIYFFYGVTLNAGA